MVKTTEELPWTKATMELTAREFEVPAGTQFVLVMPEIFHRDILKKYERYRYGKANNKIRTPCPWCKSNKHVVYKSFTSRKSYVQKIKGKD